MRIAVSMLLPMPISAIIAPAITGLDLRFQASFQRSCSAVLEGQRQETAHIAVCKFTTGVGFIMGRQELGIGQQLINLAIAKDLLRRDRGPRRCSPHEGSPVQGANGLDSISVPVCAQGILCRQLLRLWQSMACAALPASGLMAAGMMPISMQRGLRMCHSHDCMNCALPG